MRLPILPCILLAMSNSNEQRVKPEELGRLIRNQQVVSSILTAGSSKIMTNQPIGCVCLIESRPAVFRRRQNPTRLKYFLQSPETYGIDLLPL